MTITNTSSSTVGLGNGVTTVWPYAFPVPNQASLLILLENATVVPSTFTTINPAQYAVTGLGSDIGGDVTYPTSGSPIAAGYKLHIVRAVPFTQPTGISNQGDFSADVVEGIADSLEMQMQQLANTVADATAGVLVYLPSTVQPIYRVNQATSVFEYSYDGGGTWSGTGQTFFLGRGTWVAGVFYNLTDTITFGGVGYVCTTAHLSAGVSPDLTKFSVIYSPTANPSQARGFSNLGFTVAVNTPANGVTVALKQADGATNPTALAPVVAGFRDPTLTSALNNSRQIGAALSTVISSGSTGGSVSAQASKIWLALIDTTALGGGVEIAWYNAGSLSNTVPFDEGALITTTAEGGAGAADSQNVWYSTTARAGVPFVIFGSFISTQAAAGTWVTAPSTVVVNPLHSNGGSVNNSATVVLSTGSPTFVDFNNLSPGTKRIKLMLSAFSTNGTSLPMVQLRTAASLEIAGYAGADTNASASGVAFSGVTGFNLATSVAANYIMHGSIILDLLDAATNLWVCTSIMGVSAGSADVLISGHSKALAGPITGVRLTTVAGADTFDGGNGSIQWEIG